MQDLWVQLRHLISRPNILVLILSSFLILSIPSEADKSNFADVEFHLTSGCTGEYCEFGLEDPTGDKAKNWVTQTDPPVQNEYYPLATWELNMGGPLDLGDSYSYLIWVESSNVEEINLRTTLFISWIDFSVDPAESRMTNISIAEVTKRAPLGSILNGNYTVELEGSALDKSDFPNGVPAYTTLGMKVETKITWIGDPNQVNHSAWLKSDTPDFDSTMAMNFRYVDIEEDVGYFVNDRVDEVNEDSLFIKLNISNALGADNFDYSSAKLSINGVSNGGKFQNSVEVKSKHTYAIWLQGIWYYQKDQNIESNTYTVAVSIKDIYGNTWESEVDYELEVDEFGLEIEFVDPYSRNGQVPKGGIVDYEFVVYNRGNTRDIFEISVDDSELPSSWTVSLISPSSASLDLTSNQFETVRLTVEVPVSVVGGSKEKFSVSIQSSSSSIIKEEVKLETTVRIYGAAFVSSPEEVVIDPDEIDKDGFYRFTVNLRNTGSDRDTFKIEAAIGGKWPSPSVEIEDIQISAVTIEKGQMQKLTVALKPVNYEDNLGEPVDFILTANSVSPGDGSAILEVDIIVDIPIDRVIDLSISIDDILVNSKPLSLIGPEDLPPDEPIKIQVLVSNNGGQGTGSFGVKLYVGQLVEDEFIVEQGVSGFGTETLILTWDSPSPGPMTLRIKVDSDLQTEELQVKRSDNSVTVSLNVGEKGSNVSGGSSDDPLLIGPSSLILALVLCVVSVIQRRKI